jgi:hypothetical protein
MRGLILSLTAASLLSAPSCGGQVKGGPGDSCRTEENCEEDLICASGICQSFIECNDCGNDCCTSSEDCVEGVCRSHCPSGTWCGEEPACCDQGEVCASGRCCSFVCGGQCCDGPDDVCRDNTCMSTMLIPCGDAWCNFGEKCIDTACCPPQRTCRMVCCAADEICETGICRRDCGGLFRCGEAGAEVCCEGDQVCHQGACFTPSEPCAGPATCPAGQFCDLDMGLCIPQGESGGCGDGKPDLVPMSFAASMSACPSFIHMSARVLNRGDGPVPVGVPSSFLGGYSLEVEFDVTVFTTRELQAGESQQVAADYPVEEGHEPNGFMFLAVVDYDGTGVGAVDECREDNNASGLISASCATP